jgi:hypothetical protein
LHQYCGRANFQPALTGQCVVISCLPARAGQHLLCATDEQSQWSAISLKINWEEKYWPLLEQDHLTLRLASIGRLTGR